MGRGAACEDEADVRDATDGDGDREGPVMVDDVVFEVVMESGW